MCWFNNWLLLKGAGSCLATHPLLFPRGGCQEQFSDAGLSYPCAKGVQTGHETITRSEERRAGVGFVRQKGQAEVKANVAAVPKRETLERWTCKILRFAAGTAKSGAGTQKGKLPAWWHTTFQDYI